MKIPPQTGTKRRKKPTIAETKETHIIAKKLAGKSNRQVGRELGIDHKTVATVLSRSQYDEIVRQYRIEHLELVKPSLDIIRKIVGANYDIPDGNARKAATDVLKGAQVQVSKQEVELAADPLANMGAGELKQRIDGLRKRISEIEGV